MHPVAGNAFGLTPVSQNRGHFRKNSDSAHHDHILGFEQQYYIGVSKNAVLRLFFLHSFWIHHEKTVNILVHCWDHENKP
jgi:hypothetical protein